VRIDRGEAETLLRRAAALADAGSTSPEWEREVESFSQVCEGKSKTHIAFLGTAMVAKAVNQNVDVFAIKQGAGTPGAYSARGLCTDVVVPEAATLGFDLGATGPEPLNNQPYFREKRVTPAITVHRGARAIVVQLCRLLGELDRVASQDDALRALASYIAVRRRYRRTATSYEAAGRLTRADELGQFIAQFVAQDSEGGKRAQAVTAGLLSAAFGTERILTGRVNDPSRHFPGDVCLLAPDLTTVQSVFEVRDKRVSESDARLFLRRVQRRGLRRAGIVAVASGQEDLSAVGRESWVLRVYLDWGSLLRELSFWWPLTEDEFLTLAHRHVYDQLVRVEASDKALEMWLKGAVD
jgi:hypothetical protein